MKKYLPLTAVLLASIYFYAPTTSWAQEKYMELQNFSKILNLVQQYYVEPTDSKKLIEGAIKGMLRELDPHTNYMPAEIFKEFESETAGQFGGIGIEISIQNGVLTIISPIEDTPAYKAGIKPGDKVVAINGQSTKGFSLIEASALLKGKNGDAVTLTVVRDKSDKPIDIVIVRGQVKVKSIKPTNLDPGFVFIRITSFIETTSDDLSAALEKFKKDNNGKIEGILIDLRRNPGGLLDQAVKVSDMFLKDGAIVSTMGRDPKSKEVSYASKKAPYGDVPIVILINEFSASASEIVSGALQDNKRAIIVGEKSFGKGSVQSVIKLGDGSGLKLTVARPWWSRDSLHTMTLSKHLARKTYRRMEQRHDDDRRGQRGRDHRQPGAGPDLDAGAQCLGDLIGQRQHHQHRRRHQHHARPDSDQHRDGGDTGGQQCRPDADQGGQRGCRHRHRRLDHQLHRHAGQLRAEHGAQCDAD